MQALLADSLPNVDGTPLRPLFLAFLPDADVLSFFETCKTCHRAVYEYNEQAAQALLGKVMVEGVLLEPSATPVRNGHGPRRVKLPPVQHLVSSVPRLLWARAHGWKGELTCTVAASGGCVEVVNLALGYLPAELGRGHRLDCLTELGRGHRLDDETCAAAARFGHLPLLKWLRWMSCPWDKYTCAIAARGGHLAMLKWAVEQGCPWKAVWKAVCVNAAGGGHLPVLKWAREQGCPWNKYTCAAAARFGHLAVLIWAREQGCPWDKYTCANAARGGHLAVLKWAIEQGCPWDEGACTAAARYGGGEQVLVWLASTKV